MPTILSNPFVVETLLPFVLIFTIVFAVLQKSEILGAGKKQIDALVSLVIALIFVAVGKATGIIISLMPLLAVGLVIILVFLILIGFFYKPSELHKGVKVTFGVIVAIAVVAAVVYTTGAAGYLINLFKGEGAEWLINIIFVAVIVGAVLAVVLSKGSSNSSSSE